MAVQTSQWQSQLSLAKNALVSGDYMTAETCLTAAMNLSHSENAPEDGVAEIFYNRGICFECRDKLADARQSFNQALHTYTRCFGPTSGQAVKAAKAKALVEIKLGRVEEAQEHFTKLLEQLIQESGEDDTEVRETQMQMRRLFGKGAAPSPVPSLIPTPPLEGEGSTPESDVKKTLIDASPVSLPADDTDISGQLSEASASARAGDLTVENYEMGLGAAATTKPPITPTATDLTPVGMAQDFAPETDPAQAGQETLQTDAEKHLGSNVANSEEPPAQKNAATALAPQQLPQIAAQIANTRSSETRLRPIGKPLPQTKGLIAPRSTDGPFDIEALVHPRDKLYTLIARIVAVWFYGLSMLCLVGFVIAPIVLVAQFVVCGMHLGNIRGRCIKVSPEQFPEVFESLENLSAVMGMPSAPDTYVLQEHGLLNAFAKRLHQKDMILISADVLEMAYGFGEAELAFVLCHELAHVKRGHVRWAWVDMPADLIPFFGHALSRAREYTCDRVAQALVPEGAVMGLVALAAGTKIYRRVNMKALYEQQDREWDFWTWYSEIHSTHPNLLNRIKALGLRNDQIKRIKEYESHAHAQ